MVTLAASGLIAAMARTNLAEFNAINAAARAGRVRGNNAALLARTQTMTNCGKCPVTLAASGEREEPVLICAPL